MTAKQWLSRGRGINREIEKLQRTRDETYEQLTSATSSISGDVVSGTKEPHKFDRIVEMVDLINRRIDELVGIKIEILTAINQLKDWRHRELLRSRYIDMKKFEEIAVEMNYSVRGVLKIHARALNAMDAILEKCS